MLWCEGDGGMGGVGLWDPQQSVRVWPPVLTQIEYVNKEICRVSLFLWRVWCVKFEENDVSVFNHVVPPLLPVFACCL